MKMKMAYCRKCKRCLGKVRDDAVDIICFRCSELPTIPFKKVPIDCYILPNGATAHFAEEVSPYAGERMKQEIMLIQKALGLIADGIIGPETRGRLNEVIGQK